MILGIDPGLENTGWGIIDENKNGGYKLVDCGVIVTSNKKSYPERLKEIYDSLLEIVKKNKITEMAMESLFFAKNSSSAIRVAEATGVIKLCGMNNGLDLVEYTPLQVKMALVGFGRAEKEQVEIMVRTELGLEEEISPSHAADAVAVALTQAFTMRV
ncbi:crossover junction endodeoxyribonuclease RuvC [Candidatus Shapirobacteria bacterium]|nr:crossover junction endodeoxyribonuclease RuvC [Candidatus Shapirobacteria bacterium]